MTNYNKKKAFSLKRKTLEKGAFASAKEFTNMPLDYNKKTPFGSDSGSYLMYAQSVILLPNFVSSGGFLGS